MSASETLIDVRPRCHWCGDDPQYQAYHDDEWGRPERDPIRLYEKLCLEGQQAGLSWITVLRKRARYREQFFDFDPVKVAALTDGDLALRMQDAGLIRHAGKLSAIRDNARAYLALQAKGVDFSAWLWGFVGGKTQVNPWTDSRIPTATDASRAMSKALKKAGFRFVGETTCYAFMQSMGMVDDHAPHCWVRLAVQSTK